MTQILRSTDHLRFIVYPTNTYRSYFKCIRCIAANVRERERGGGDLSMLCDTLKIFLL